MLHLEHFSHLHLHKLHIVKREGVSQKLFSVFSAKGRGDHKGKGVPHEKYIAATPVVMIIVMKKPSRVLGLWETKMEKESKKKESDSKKEKSFETATYFLYTSSSVTLYPSNTSIGKVLSSQKVSLNIGAELLSRRTRLTP
mmetsp:Transcript_35713/g.93080  ORF Transcript_35713/g.93080 Transcript_35713/m.93080 type:complete len:141 (-) Transcript_35713:68-490(-)